MPETDITSHLVLSHYSVSPSAERKIKDEMEDVEFLTLSTQTHEGYFHLLKSLRRQRAEQLYILGNDDALNPLIPMLIVIAWLMPVRQRYLLKANYVPVSLNLNSLFKALLLVGCSLTCNFLYLIRASLRLVVLMRLKPVQRYVDNCNFDHILCLRSSLWLGLQAGGATSHTVGVVKSLIKKKKKISFYSHDILNLPFSEYLTQHRVIPSFAYIIPRELNHISYHYRMVSAVDKNACENRPVIYQRSSLGNFSGVELARRYRLPLVVEYNGSELWLASNWGTPFAFPWLVRLSEEILLRHASLIVVVSEPLRRELINRGISDDKIVMHPNGVDVDMFSPDRFSDDQKKALRTSLQIGEDKTVFTFLGTFGPWHGAELIAKAAVKLDISHPNSKRVFMFVGDGVRVSKVRELSKNLKDQDSLVFTGTIEYKSVPEYLAISDVVISPTMPNADKTDFFGSPTKLFEYLASGKPIIASGVGQIAEVMEGALRAPYQREDALKNIEGQCGILIEPNNVDALAAAILFAESNKDWCHEVGRNGRQRAMQNYTWDHHLDFVLKKLRSELTKGQKITLLINGLHSISGGGITYLKNILSKISKHENLDVHLCLQSKQKELYSNVSESVTIHVFKTWRLLFMRLLYEQWRVPRLASEINADVTFSLANYGPLFAPGSVILLRNALSVAFVERRPGKLLYWSLLWTGTLLSLMSSTRCIAVSKFALDQMRVVYLMKSRNFSTVIPHGVNEAFRADTNFDQRSIELLAVSDLYIQKNLHSLLLSLVHVKKSYPSIVLRIAGAPVDSIYASDLYDQVARLDLGENVVFEGSVSLDVLSELYRKCGIFVFPSTVETFGNPLLEAMASGCPIACSNTAAMPEVAGDSVSYFDPHDPTDISQVICELLGDPDRRKKLSRLAMERSKQFSWDESARKTINVIIEAAQMRCG